MTLPTPGSRPFHYRDFFYSDEEDNAADDVDMGNKSDPMKAYEPEEKPAQLTKPTTSKATEPATGIGIKLKLSKCDLFIKSLGQWYLNLPEKQKGRLTLKRFRKRAIYEAFRIKLFKKSVPHNYIEVLKRDYGLQLYRKIRIGSEIGDDDPSHEVKDFYKEATGHLDPEKDVRITRSGRVSKKPVPFQATKKGAHHLQNFSIKQEKPDDIKTENVDDNNGSGEPEVKTLKKIVDLTGNAPPDWWIQKCKDGCVPPRELRIYPAQDRTFVFYDYDLPRYYYDKTAPGQGKPATKAARPVHDQMGLNFLQHRK